MSWPKEEIEWMAATAFNHAVDYFNSQEAEKAKEWATKAISLAHYGEDEGGLERTLQEKYMRLGLDAVSVSSDGI